MEIYSVKSATQQDDWRFWDIAVDVFEVSEDEINKTDCSVCAINDLVPIRQVKIVLPYSLLPKEII